MRRKAKILKLGSIFVFLMKKLEEISGSSEKKVRDVILRLRLPNLLSKIEYSQSKEKIVI